MEKRIWADGRWRGTHGIGRFTHEVLSRLTNTEILTTGPSPLSAKNLVWQPYQLAKNKNRFDIFFNPGFNPILYSPIPYILTIHDLIHLNKFSTKLYYETLIRKTAYNAFKILTVSEFSKQTIIDWLKIPENKVIVAGNGISQEFSLEGDAFNPGFPYLLHIGNNKPHKNILRLLQAFAIAKIDNSFRLVLTAKCNDEIKNSIRKHSLEERIIFCNNLSDSELAKYYRGATAFVFPSLYEGFGIPILEAMACGAPVISSNTSSLPEVAGNAAIYIDPFCVDSIADGIEKIIDDTKLRGDYIKKGLERCQLFSWDGVAKKVERLLNL